MIQPVYRILVQYEQQGKALSTFRNALADVMDDREDQGRREVQERAWSYALLRRAATSAG